MKIISLATVTFVIATFLATPVALAAENTAKSEADVINNEDDFTPCGVAQSDEDYDALPAKETPQGEISYVSGGTCIDDAQLMKGIANKFPLEVVLVEKTKAYEKENYLADVRVKISNLENKPLLDVYTEGPFLLVNLPNGQYLVSAEYTGITKVRKVNIKEKGHARVVFRWEEPTESEEPQ
jgi:hypothetical protein